MKQRLRWFSLALFSLACASSLIAYFFLPSHMQEACYMLAVLFVFMAGFCLI